MDLAPSSLPHVPMGMHPVPYPTHDEWCHIAYYELNNRIGELFKVRPQPRPSLKD